jgi:hypothetical protein
MQFMKITHLSLRAWGFDTSECISIIAFSEGTTLEVLDLRRYHLSKGDFLHAMPAGLQLMC